MVRATIASAFGWKPKGVSRRMALSRGWPTRAVSSWWTDVITGLVSPEPKMAINRGGRVCSRSTPECYADRVRRRGGEFAARRPTNTRWPFSSKGHRTRVRLLRAARPGHQANQGDNSPANQGVDRDCDQRLRFQNGTALDSGVEDAVEGGHHELGDVVHESDEAGNGRAPENLQGTANDQQDVDEPDDPPDDRHHATGVVGVVN